MSTQLTKGKQHASVDGGIAKALHTGLENIFIQQTESVDKGFIPPFDFTEILR